LAFDPIWLDSTHRYVAFIASSDHTIQDTNLMSKPIFRLVDSLPENNLTVKSLKALDFVAPGQWTNLVGFEHTIKVISGESDQAMIQKIGERAIALYNDKKQGYQRAVWLYQTVESMSNVLGFTALVNKVGEKVHLLGFLNRITPKADKAQGIDFSVKLVTELLAYTAINGIPGDSIGDFVKGLTHYKDEALMRMAALICFDGIIPLGPDYIEKALNFLKVGGPSALEENDSFQRIKSVIPGSGTAEQLGLLQKSVDSVSGWMNSFSKQHDLSAPKIVDNLKHFIQITDDRLDFVAALIDETTDYYEHTGIQSVARSLIERAVNEI
jgi:hypothetical protein